MLLCNPGDGAEEEYLAVLIQQLYVSCHSQPWKVIFTVYRQNLSCVEVKFQSFTLNIAEIIRSNVH